MPGTLPLPIPGDSVPGLRQFPHMHMLIGTQLKIQGKLFRSSDSSVQLFLSQYSFLWTRVTLFMPDFQLPLKSGNHSGSTWVFPFLHYRLESLLRQQARVNIGLISLVSFLLGITVIQCMISSVLKTIALYIFFIYWLFKGGRINLGLLLHLGQKYNSVPRIFIGRRITGTIRYQERKEK